MALQNDPRIYSGGGVVFNTNPSLNLRAQLLAKKQARDEAIDEYYRKLPGTINNAGMRDQDREGFDKGVNALQSYWMGNRDKIRKGNTPEAFQYEKMLRDIKTGVDLSKQAAKTDLELGKMRFEKDKEYIFTDPDFMSAQQLHATPVWDAKHKQMDLGTIAIPPKPFGVDEQNRLWKATTEGLNAGKIYDYKNKRTDKISGQVIVPFSKVFGKEQIGTIADRAAKLVNDDRSAKAYYQSIIDKPDSQDWQKLQDAYAKYFDGVVDTPQKAAAADAILRASVPQEQGEEQEINYSQRQNDKVANIILNLSGRGAGADTIANYDVLKKYEPLAVPKRVKSGKPSNWFGAQQYEDVQVIPANQIDKEHKKMINVQPIFDRGDKDGYYILLPDGNWKGQNDQIIRWDVIAQKEMDRASQNEVRRGRQNPQRGASGNVYQEPQNQSPVRVPKDIKQTKMTLKKDPLGLGL